MCRVKFQGRGHSQNKRYKEAIAESSLTFQECSSLVGFTDCKAQGKGYYEPKDR
jgi:hypothetical protein